MKKKEEINLEQGKRLDKCLKDAKIQQKSFAKMTGYTPQHINNIIKGKRNMSYEAAKIFSETLFRESNGKVNVCEEYLMGIVNSKNEGIATRSVFQLNSNIEILMEIVLELMGFEKKKSFLYDFDKFTSEQKEKYCSLKNDSPIQKPHIGFAFGLGHQLLFEFENDLGQTFYIDSFDYSNLIEEIIEYIRFKANHDFKLKNKGDDNDFSNIKEESIVEIFDTSLAKDAKERRNEIKKYKLLDEEHY